MKFKPLRKFFYEKEVYSIDENDPNLINIHNKILKNKPILKSVFTDFYKDIKLETNNNFNSDGLKIELGSGVGFFKKIDKNIITSDVRFYNNLSLLFSAYNIPFKNNSVRAIYAINVFHHFNKPDLFFKEAIRVLKKNGGIILIEPHNGFLSKIIHRFIHKNEHFDTSTITWNNESINGALKGANQAMAHNIFTRDEFIFKNKYKQLSIVDKKYHISGIRYLFSGGLNFTQLVPNILLPILRIFESFFAFLSKKNSTLHQIIIIKKISE